MCVSHESTGYDPWFDYDLSICIRSIYIPDGNTSSAGHFTSVNFYVMFNSTYLRFWLYSLSHDIVRVCFLWLTLIEPPESLPKVFFHYNCDFFRFSIHLFLFLHCRVFTLCCSVTTLRLFTRSIYFVVTSTPKRHYYLLRPLPLFIINCCFVCVCVFLLLKQSVPILASKIDILLTFYNFTKVSCLY